MSSDLDTLASRAQTGDTRAFELLAAGVAPHGHRLAWRLLGDADQAADVLQDFLIRLMRVLDRYDPRRPFLPWALRIVSRLALDQLRHRSRLQETSLEAARDALAPTAQRPDMLLDAADSHLALLRLCRDLEGFSVDEIAGMTGAAASTVRVHLARARLRLRNALQADDSKEVRR